MRRIKKERDLFFLFFLWDEGNGVYFNVDDVTIVRSEVRTSTYMEQIPDYQPHFELL